MEGINIDNKNNERIKTIHYNRKSEKINIDDDLHKEQIKKAVFRQMNNILKQKMA